MHARAGAFTAESPDRRQELLNLRIAAKRPVVADRTGRVVNLPWQAPDSCRTARVSFFDLSRDASFRLSTNSRDVDPL